MKKRALLVGIDFYEPENISNLGGCTSDARRIGDRLGKNLDDGSTNFHCESLLGSAKPGVTRDQVKAKIRECFGPGADVALFYFAGHGKSLAGSDVALVTSDATPETPGVEFSFVMEQIVRSDAKEKIVVLDCCFSGASGGVPQLGLGEGAFLPEGTTILAASRGDQVSMESGEGGLFTTSVCLALDGGAADILGNVTTAGVYGYVDRSFGAWGQRPTFRANVDALHVLRSCPPTISRESLETLACEIFVDRRIVYPLDPSYEPEEPPHVEAHERLFAVLQEARANKLVSPVGAPHLYHAAMEGLGCELTPAGRYYCDLVQRGLI